MTFFSFRAKVNGKQIEMEISPELRLIDFLRDILGLTGTKEGCGEGECGACTVIVDGEVMDSCLLLVPQVNGKEIITIEGLDQDKEIHPIQQAFLARGAVQCGYCTPGMILAAKALLDKNSQPSKDEIAIALSGNICRCTGYAKILEAVEDAAEKIVSSELRDKTD